MSRGIKGDKIKSRIAIDSYQLNWCRGVVRTSVSIILMTLERGEVMASGHWPVVTLECTPKGNPKPGIGVCNEALRWRDAILNNLYNLLGHLRLIFGHTTNENNKLNAYVGDFCTFGGNILKGEVLIAY